MCVRNLDSGLKVTSIGKTAISSTHTHLHSLSSRQFHAGVSKNPSSGGGLLLARFFGKYLQEVSLVNFHRKFANF